MIWEIPDGWKVSNNWGGIIFMEVIIEFFLFYFLIILQRFLKE